MGKSTVGRNWAVHLGCNLGKRVLLEAMEQSKEETIDAMVASIAGIPLMRLIERTLEERDWDKLARARRKVDGAQIIVKDQPNLTIPGFYADLRRHKPHAAVIDQLQHLTPPRSARSREEEVARLSTDLKKIARAEEIPLLVVSKMNRGPEQRTDKRPQMTDLRESGNIESDADAIILLYRDDFYDKESPRAGEVDFIIEKQRRGPKGTVVLAAQLHYQRFVDMA